MTGPRPRALCRGSAHSGSGRSVLLREPVLELLVVGIGNKYIK